MLNPTSCAKRSLTESTLTGTTLLGSSTFTTAEAKSPLVVEECNKLAFKPSFAAIAGAKTSIPNGANIEVNIGHADWTGEHRAGDHDAAQAAPGAPLDARQSLPGGDLRSRSRAWWLPKEANVGTVKATTPVLPGTLTGTA